MLCIKPISDYWDFKHGLFADKFRDIMQNANPLNDPWIHRLYIIRYNLLRQYKIYTYEKYWNRMPNDLQTEALAYAKYYVDAFDYYSNIQLQYERDKCTKIPINWKQFKINDEQTSNYLQDYFNLPEIDELYIKNLLYQLTPPRNKARNPSTNTMWYKNQGWMQDAIHSSECLLFQQFAHNRGANKLRKSPGNPVLFTDKAIPMPTYATYLAWYNLIGNQYSQSKFEWDYPIISYLFSFVLPHMPVTKEHMVYGSPQAGAIDWNESLPYRNVGHDKDNKGNIIYGEWTNVIAELATNNISVKSMHSFSASETINHLSWQSQQIMPHQYIYGHHIYNPVMLDEVVCIGMNDNTGRFESPFSIHQGSVSKGMKILARDFNLYMSFTDKSIAYDWTLRFIKIAHQWLNPTMQKFNQSMINELVKLIAIEPNKEKSSADDRLGVDIKSFFK